MTLNVIFLVPATFQIPRAVKWWCHSFLVVETDFNIVVWFCQVCQEM